MRSYYGEALLITPGVLDREAELWPSEQHITLHAAYRNDRHYKQLIALRKEPQTDFSWLPSYQPMKLAPFRDIWLAGKSELKRLRGHGK